MKVLITGGAGYIGSHTVKKLLEKTKYDLIVIDNLSTGSLKTINTLKNIRDFEFLEVDLKEVDKVADIIKNYNIDVIIHFAASIIVSESIVDPLKYYMNNTINTTYLIDIAISNGVKKFIFSSTAAVYGEPSNIPTKGIDENYETSPINPYGMSKLMSERILKDSAKSSSNFKYVIFRYFNVAGADIFYENGELSPRIGQSFPQATSLIKIASECASKKRDKLYLYGDTYDTFDGTCIRDYIHVDDLSEAHVQAIGFLNHNDSEIFNIGYSKGYSVNEVCKIMKKVSNFDFKIDIVEKREGDPSHVIANNKKILEKMNWQPKYDNLELICESSYRWEQTLK